MGRRSMDFVNILLYRRFNFPATLPVSLTPTLYMHMGRGIILAHEDIINLILMIRDAQPLHVHTKVRYSYFTITLSSRHASLTGID